MSYFLKYRRYTLPFRAPVRTAHGPWLAREGLLVRLEDAGSGLCSYGEVAPLPWFGTETVEAAEAALEKLRGEFSAPWLTALPPELVCTRCALNQALRAPGKSPGGPEYLQMAALLPAGPAVLGAVAAKAELGFRVFKWKVGVGDAADELSLMEDLFALLPSGSKLRLDANGAWDRRRAERWLERCSERPVEFVEQPIAADAKASRDLLLGLAGDFPCPLALDESLVSEAELDFWLGAGWPGVYVFKPLLAADAWSSVAKLEKAKATVVFSSSLETGLGAQQILRLAFAWGGERRALGMGVWPLFEDARFDGPRALPFIRREELDTFNPESLWNALS